MTSGVWTEEVRVPSYDVTPRGTASVLAMADYFQEAAGRHAAELGVSMQDLLESGQAWVLADLRLEIERLPQWEERITVETWPSGLDGLFATREVVVWGEAGDACCRGTSAWLVIDTERRQPRRPPARLYDIEPPDRPSPLPSDREDLPVPERADGEGLFAVRYHDLDLNRHVNNVRYLEWALETLSADVLDDHRCVAVALQFEAEATLGDRIRARAEVRETAGGLEVRHELVQADAGRTLAVAQTRWRPHDESAANSAA